MTLQGKRIVVTRATDQSAALTALLKHHGAEPVAWPVLRTSALPLDAATRDALLRADWLVFSSINGVRYTLPTLNALDRKDWRVAAVGPKTGEAVSNAGLTVTLMPAHFDAASMTQALLQSDAALINKRVVVVGGVLSPDDVARALRGAGAEVAVAIAYRTEATDQAPPPESAIDALTFASESAVHFAALKLSAQARKTLPTVCLGARTATAARAAGMRVARVARVHTDEGLLDALHEHFQTNPS
jgi:uroporphyrinogen-III synthase